MPDSIMPIFSAGLDFPANPNVGDVFMGWTWDGTKWIRTPVIPPAQLMVSVGPSPPGSPADGFLWWDSVGGNLYMWYVDATSSQWVIANVGIMGPTGAQGPPGPAVPAVTLQASVPTQADLPTTGNVAGDARITVDTGDLWVWDGTVWFNAGPIQGPPGVAGAPGPQGPAGPPGPVGEAPTDGQYYVRQGSTASWSPASANYLPLTGGSLTAAANFAAGGQLVTLPNNALDGLIAGRVLSGGSNLAIAAYADAGTTWRQINGTGTGNAAATSPAVIGTSGGNITFSVASTVADGGALTLINACIMGTTATNFPGGVGMSSLSLGGLPAITNNAGFIATGSSIMVPGDGGYACGTPSGYVSWNNNAGFFYTQNTILSASGLACGVPGGAVSWSNQAGFMYCSSSVSVFTLSVGNVISGGALTWSNNAGYMYCPSSVMANAFVDISDPSLKKDIGNAKTGALATVLAVPVKRYHFKSDAESVPLRTGFMAIDVAKVYPDAVATVDEGVQGLHLGDMNAILWQAVQELAAKVAALEAR